MINRLLNFFTSLRLTVVCLGLALLLVFIGTLAQVSLGLYNAQSEFFRSVFVYWHPAGTHWKIPVFPGGWLLGGVLLINLLAAHAKRFEVSRKRIGIFLIHGGLILLLVGQFLTEITQIESTMRLEVGTTRNFTEDSRHLELAIIDVTAKDRDEVVSIPERLLIRKEEVRHPKLPFTVRVKNYFNNSIPAGPMSSQSAEKIVATQGVGQRLQFAREKETTSMDDENKPAALVEIVAEAKSLGDWSVSTWLTKHPWKEVLSQEMGMSQFTEVPQEFNYGGHTYQLALRPVRYYKPFYVTLLEFHHDIYKGTDIPKNFASKVRVQNPATAENREVLIYMNNPLRYAGETFYQAGFEPGDTVTILQVVKNPAAITPYLSCTIMGGGLLIHFLMTLFGFFKRRSAQLKAVEQGPRKSKPRREELEPALAGGRKSGKGGNS
jgi:hypothetical protein